MSTRKRNRNGDFIGEEADHHSVSAHDPNSSANQSYQFTVYLYEAYILPFLLQNWCNSILRVLNILMHGPICVYVDILT